MKQFRPIKKLREHPTAKNKHLSAVFITKDNVEEIQEDTNAFSVLNDSALLVGFMHFQRFPVWMVCINPKGKANKFIFESEETFKSYFELESEPNAKD